MFAMFGGTLGGQEIILITLLVILLVVPYIVAIWALMDWSDREFPSPKEKWIWLLAIFSVFACSIIGPAIYVIAGRARGKKPSSPS